MPNGAGDDGDDPVIRAERVHLIQSRDYLRLMREDVLAINPMAGDRVSLEYLKADLYRRPNHCGTSPTRRCSSAVSTTTRTSSRRSRPSCGTGGAGTGRHGNCSATGSPT
jgi:hypothetical protein